MKRKARMTGIGIAVAVTTVLSLGTSAHADDDGHPWNSGTDGTRVTGADTWPWS